MDVFLAVPTMGSLQSDLAAFVQNFADAGGEVRLFNHYTPMPYARNIIADAFLQSDKKRLWMIDSDMVLPNNVMSLLHTEGDIVGAIYPRSAVRVIGGSPVLEYCAHRYADEGNRDTLITEFHPDIGQGPLEVSSIGDGCKIIRREVLEDERMRVGPIGENGLAPIWRNHFEDDGRYTYGNDIDFCLRAKRLGYSVVLDTDVFCGHMKTFDLGAVVKLVEFYRGNVPIECFAEARV